MELGALVSLRLAHGGLGLAGAELAKVLCRARDDILEELEGDPTERLSYSKPSKLDQGPRCHTGHM